MKIIVKRKIGQFDVVPVICHDAIMAEMLVSSPNSKIEKFSDHQNLSVWMLNTIENARLGITSYYEWMFHSGAKLKLQEKPHHFYIYTYSSDGKDGYDAIKELKMLEAVYQVRKKHKIFCQSDNYLKDSPPFLCVSLGKD